MELLSVVCLFVREVKPSLTRLKLFRPLTAQQHLQMLCTLFVYVLSTYKDFHMYDLVHWFVCNLLLFTALSLSGTAQSAIVLIEFLHGLNF